MKIKNPILFILLIFSIILLPRHISAQVSAEIVEIEETYSTREVAPPAPTKYDSRNNLSKTKSGLEDSLAQREKEISKLYNTIASLNEDIAYLKDSLPKKIQDVKKPLENEIERLSAELVSVNNDYRERIRELEQKASADLSNKEQELQSQVVSLKQRYEVQLSQQKHDYEERLTSQQQRLQKEISSLGDEVLDEKKKNRSQLSDIKSQLKEKDALVRNLEKEKSRLEIESKRKDKQIADLEKTISNLNQDMVNLKDSIPGKIAAVRSPLDEKIERLSSESIALRKDSGSQVSALSIQLKEKDSKIKSFDKERADLENKLKKVNKSLSDSEDAIFRIRKDFQVVKSKVDKKIKAAKAPLEQTIDNLSVHLISLKDASQADLIELEKRWQERFEVKQKNFYSDLASQLEVAQNRFNLKEDRLLERIDILEEELEELRKSSDREIRLLNDKFMEEQSQKVSFKEQSTDLAKRLEQREREIVYLDKNIASLGEELGFIRSSLSDKSEGIKKEYEKKISQQKKDLEQKLFQEQKQAKEQIADLNKQASQLKGTVDNQEDKVQVQLREKESIISTLNKDKSKLSSELKEKDKELTDLKIAMAKQKEDFSKGDQVGDLIQLTSSLREKDARIQELKKENEDFKNYLNQRDDELASLKSQISSLKADTGYSAAAPSELSNQLTSDEKMWHNEKKEFEEYYLIVRDQIFDRLKKVDFSEYKGKIDTIKVEFELYSSGMLKSTPKFYGTSDRKLKSILNRSFKQALPFPKFPQSLDKSSKRFIISISFE